MRKEIEINGKNYAIGDRVLILDTHNPSLDGEFAEIQGIRVSETSQSLKLKLDNGLLVGVFVEDVMLVDD